MTKGIALGGLFGNSGMKWWNGTLEWNTGMEYWNVYNTFPNIFITIDLAHWQGC